MSEPETTAAAAKVAPKVAVTPTAVNAAGDSTTSAAGGNDTLTGAQGSDDLTIAGTITAGAGNDTIVSGAGDDLIPLDAAPSRTAPKLSEADAQAIKDHAELRVAELVVFCRTEAVRVGADPRALGGMIASMLRDTLDGDDD